jgi:hypothetical protein
MLTNMKFAETKVRRVKYNSIVSFGGFFRVYLRYCAKIQCNYRLKHRQKQPDIIRR